MSLDTCGPLNLEESVIILHSPHRRVQAIMKALPIINSEGNAPENWTCKKRKNYRELKKFLSRKYDSQETIEHLFENVSLYI